MASGFPNIPVVHDYVIFKLDWHYIEEKQSYASTTVNATFSTNTWIPAGTIGRVLGVEVDPGYGRDTAGGYMLFIGVQTQFGMTVLKFPFTSRPEVLESVPDTPAARVLYGKK